MTLFTKPIARKALCAIVIAGASLLPFNAMADEVTLKSSDGTVNLVGEFVDFQDDHYIIRTGLGDLRIAASRVRCEGEACPVFETTSADVRFAGSETVGLGVMPLLLSGYASYLDAEASIVATENEGEILADMIGDGGFGEELDSYLVTSTSSGTAFQSLLDGSADIGMSARRIQPQEARDLKASGAGNMVSPTQEHIVAVDSIVIITHPSNPISDITIEQLRGIYAGNINNWSELGGKDMPITLVARQEGSGTRSSFEDRLFGDQPAVLRSDALIADDNNSMAAAVNSDEAALGFVGYAFQRGAKPVNLINECGIASTPDAFSAKTEEYAFQRRLYLYNRGDSLTEPASNFLDYALSAEADGVIAKAGFIDLGVKSQEQSLDGARARALLDPNADAFEAGVMREMLGQMVNYDRLSTTFRFRTGSSRIDERGRIDMKRLVDFLRDKPEGTKVMLVGFTDSVGAFESNRDLSIVRAGEVREALLEAAGGEMPNIEFDHTGFGEIAPSACNTNENGRAVNRRVEVWYELPSNL